MDDAVRTTTTTNNEKKVTAVRGSAGMKGSTHHHPGQGRRGRSMGVDDSGSGSLVGDITAYSKLDWDRFSQWVVCIAAVTFDLEAGQDIEEMLPSQHTFPKAITDNIKGLAFPDNNSGCVGDMSYTFRFKNHARRPHSQQTQRPATACT
ncbi:hypothetical protein PTSG_12161 [Salpingoeca rosetta]|uniref:Uncharacterized protein n=1 Tax=Salpingoeca rosetta (strain ATCC 50818 / BSB-021) TaxID=946362 RepID=F2U8E6_SALR5|nr:uncharacterized protein PTSG_12161 [Salpingoeca rosetta]EGD72654.1 hypothetical protein PTSG_12161 [Salpingoeca rosetta]|eukprot:XP_004994477.1 hypothetical protein PTSG_12161 [Salpingoeca rosetta]